MRHLRLFSWSVWCWTNLRCLCTIIKKNYICLLFWNCQHCGWQCRQWCYGIWRGNTSFYIGYWWLFGHFTRLLLPTFVTTYLYRKICQIAQARNQTEHGGDKTFRSRSFIISYRWWRGLVSKEPDVYSDPYGSLCRDSCVHHSRRRIVHAWDDNSNYSADE